VQSGVDCRVSLGMRGIDCTRQCDVEIRMMLMGIIREEKSKKV